MSGKDFSDLIKRTYQELEEIWRVLTRKIGRAHV